MGVPASRMSYGDAMASPTHRQLSAISTRVRDQDGDGDGILHHCPRSQSQPAVAKAMSGKPVSRRLTRWRWRPDSTQLPRAANAAAEVISDGVGDSCEEPTPRPSARIDNGKPGLPPGVWHSLRRRAHSALTRSGQGGPPTTTLPARCPGKYTVEFLVDGVPASVNVPFPISHRAVIAVVPGTRAQRHAVEQPGASSRF